MPSLDTLDRIARRVEWALQENRHTERIVIGLVVAIFLLGVAIFIFGYWVKSPYVTGSAVLMQGFLYWPIKILLQVRRDNIMLGIVPEMVAALPPDRADKQLEKLMESLRTGR